MICGIELTVNWRERPTLSIPEVARLTGLHERDVAKLIDDQVLTTLSIGGKVLVHTEDVVRVFSKPTRAIDSPRLRRIAEEMGRRIRSAE